MVAMSVCPPAWSWRAKASCSASVVPRSVLAPAQPPILHSSALENQMALKLDE
jgi:hypothetical protein